MQYIEIQMQYMHDVYKIHDEILYIHFQRIIYLSRDMSKIFQVVFH